MRTLALVALALLAPTASAQLFATAIPTGTWSGTLSRPGGQVALTAEVEECAEGLKLTVKPTRGAEQEVRDLQIETNRVRFRFVEPLGGRPVACTLTRRTDESYRGACTASRGPALTLVLRPPARSTLGCSE
ncbi:MAG TPA: hypothetical protein VD962_13060 [Rubricoccaceae bacterium]|nr:hypothetical protein [Rubricoccaceae bacterium]